MAEPKEESPQTVEKLVGAITKSYGKGSLMRVGDKGYARDIPVIPTGSLQLDNALGVGGLPRGRIVEIFGPESSGKTTLALSVIAMAQAAGGICAFIDAEHALDINYANALRVDVENLLVSQPDDGEQALDIVEALADSGIIDVIVVDSVSALVPRAELAGEMGDMQMGLQARLMSKAMRKLHGIASKKNCIIIFINQIRMKIGVVFGNPETTSGGNALKFFSSVRMDVRRKSFLTRGENERIGARTCVKIIKNKVAPPFKEAEFDLLYGTGINREAEIIDMAVGLGIIAKAGAWYSYNDERIGQGKDSVMPFLAERPELVEEILGKIKAAA